MDDPTWEARALDAESRLDDLSRSLDETRERLQDHDEREVRLAHLRTLFPTAIDPDLAASAALDVEGDDESIVRAVRASHPFLWRAEPVTTTGESPDPRRDAHQGARRLGDRSSLLRYLRLRAS
ncbi:MAG: hypothetical protein KDA28_07325 [Phycisphaerales bacterium]|nr:hypothetical protein [Phycisphaerales bacterium]